MENNKMTMTDRVKDILCLNIKKSEESLPEIGISVQSEELDKKEMRFINYIGSFTPLVIIIFLLIGLQGNGLSVAFFMLPLLLIPMFITAVITISKSISLLSDGKLNSTGITLFILNLVALFTLVISLFMNYL